MEWSGKARGGDERGVEQRDGEGDGRGSRAGGRGKEGDAVESNGGEGRGWVHLDWALLILADLGSKGFGSAQLG